MGIQEIKDANMHGMTGTKLLIFEAAVDLFYERGYSNVGIRDISDAAGIKSASIYNHFESKDALLEQIYTFFYDNYFDSLPDFDEILALIPTTHPTEVLGKMQMPFANKNVYNMIKKIVLIFEYECNNKQRAKDVVSGIFSINTYRISKALEKMIELDLIEPLNVDLYASVLVRYSLSAASRVEDLRNISLAEWRAGNKLLLSLVKITKKGDALPKVQA
jgi:AcrR family transcriptional regulator